ncbi:hypothetical protein BU23DRAFT_32195 [Bimuria novae-zelandiae CBS 107.79]|uniref:Uncharacterized protein n=1 Tax=Bimuria novae-zelandiae CBS 107.79 TaxID=1447943 RepID=A0A6A5VGK7_9PLEO|nr:hypothetical protein BU23DRAFT_32195 [Bimuria novae-zelandiae CBS 107.79]
MALERCSGALKNVTGEQTARPYLPFSQISEVYRTQTMQGTLTLPGYSECRRKPGQARVYNCWMRNASRPCRARTRTYLSVTHAHRVCTSFQKKLASPRVGPRTTQHCFATSTTRRVSHGQHARYVTTCDPWLWCTYTSAATSMYTRRFGHGVGKRHERRRFLPALAYSFVRFFGNGKWHFSQSSP